MAFPLWLYYKLYWTLLSFQIPYLSGRLHLGADRTGWRKVGSATGYPSVPTLLVLPTVDVKLQRFEFELCWCSCEFGIGGSALFFSTCSTLPCFCISTTGILSCQFIFQWLCLWILLVHLLTSCGPRLTRFLIYFLFWGHSRWWTGGHSSLPKKSLNSLLYFFAQRFFSRLLQSGRDEGETEAKVIYKEKVM